MNRRDDGRICVLVCDDEADIVEVTRGCLEGKGFSTRGTTSGQEALRMIKEDAPDVLVLDVLMPGMGGIDVLKALRSDEATRDLPVIILSALVDAQNVINCFDEGADDYVMKPPDFDEMAARIRRHAETARRHAEASARGRSPAGQGGPTNLRIVETAIKQIALAAQLAQEKDDRQFQLQCLERIRGFCGYAMKVLNERRD